MAEIIQGKILPENSQVVGMAWLVHHLHLAAPLRTFSCQSLKRLDSQRKYEGGWNIFDSQIQISNSVPGHLEFSLKFETIDLLVFKKVFENIQKRELEQYIESFPRGKYQRKIWFLYEYLTGDLLSLEDLKGGAYENFLDERKYVTLAGEKSKRHKINNNLLGTPDFCSVIQRTPLIDEALKRDYQEKIKEVLSQVSNRLIRRAASFLLLSDSKASFEIEGERGAKNRIERWCKIINEAGKYSLSFKEIERLHSVLIGDQRFTKIGLREEGVFLGDHDESGDPIPEFIGAKSEDLEALIESWLKLNERLEDSDAHPVVQAVIMAFSFVYIHPLEDGNGRIHRYLLHHILGERSFYQKGLVFPISASILDEIETYKETLVVHSAPLMDYIEWEVTSTKNVKVLNETQDMYRYFDGTKALEFVFHCIDKTINEKVPDELRYLESFDRAFDEIISIIEMPDNKIKSLINLIIQNNGTLSKTKKKQIFPKLQDRELEQIESIVRNYFSWKGLSA